MKTKVMEQLAVCVPVDSAQLYYGDVLLLQYHLPSPFLPPSLPAPSWYLTDALCQASTLVWVRWMSVLSFP